MDTLFLTDAARCVHLIGLAFGLGFAIRADHVAFSFLYRPLSEDEIDTLDTCHRIVSLGLVLFWISGVTLLWFRTGFVIEEFSEKLMLKVGVVTVLTFNAVLIGRFAMPTMQAWKHTKLGEVPIVSRTFLAVIAGLSAASWASALALGVFSAMKVMDPMRMYEVIGAVYAAGLGGALLVSILAPLVLAFKFGPKTRVISTNDPEHQLQNLRPAS